MGEWSRIEEMRELTAYDGFKPIEWAEQKHPEPALP